MTEQEYIQAVETAPVFSLDPETEQTAYLAERNRLIDCIYQYMKEQDPFMVEYGLELVETVTACLQAFQGEKGSFLHYFNLSFAKKRKIAAAKNGLQERSYGMHFTDSGIRTAGAVYHYLNAHQGIGTEELENNIKAVAESLEMSQEELKKGIRQYKDSLVRSANETITDTEGEIALLDAIASGNDTAQAAVLKLEMEQLMKTCSICYREARARTRNFLSLKLTYEFWGLAVDEDQIRMLKEQPFYDERITAVMDSPEYMERGKLTDLEMAEMTGRTPSSACVLWKRFTEKVAARLNGEMPEGT